jgi:hypothetical protein
MPESSGVRSTHVIRLCEVRWIVNELDDKRVRDVAQLVIRSIQMQFLPIEDVLAAIRGARFSVSPTCDHTSLRGAGAIRVTYFRSGGARRPATTLLSCSDSHQLLVPLFTLSSSSSDPLSPESRFSTLFLLRFTWT